MTPSLPLLSVIALTIILPLDSDSGVKFAYCEARWPMEQYENVQRTCTIGMVSISIHWIMVLTLLRQLDKYTALFGAFKRATGQR